MAEEEKDEIYLDETASSDGEAAFGIYEKSEESEKSDGSGDLPEVLKEAGKKKRNFRFHFRNPLTIID
ncbi:MAG: hypothetical protein K2L00_02805, partial [Muribaculaceae bacterium]|nr:hypothetical protein [Muribaculaceae bacterium]